MLDDLHRAYRVEPFAGFGQRLGGVAAIFDIESGLCGMGDRDGDVLRCRVDADHLGAEAGEGLGQDAAAATDVDDAQAFERPHRRRITAEMPVQMVAQETPACGIEPMQRSEDGKSGEKGKSVSDRVGLGSRRSSKKKKKT